MLVWSWKFVQKHWFQSLTFVLKMIFLTPLVSPMCVWMSSGSFSWSPKLYLENLIVGLLRILWRCPLVCGFTNLLFIFARFMLISLMNFPTMEAILLLACFGAASAWATFLTARRNFFKLHWNSFHFGTIEPWAQDIVGREDQIISYRNPVLVLTNLKLSSYGS